MASELNGVLVDAFDRVRDLVQSVVDGLSPDDLTFRVDPEANTIAWLTWHLTRIQDDHVADVAEADQVWTADGWSERLALPYPPHATGFGHSSEDVAAVRVDGDLLTGYHDAVHQRTVEFVSALDEAELSRVVDDSWDPPVTLGVRIVSVIGDNLQHVGQAAFVRGVVERRH